MKIIIHKSYIQLLAYVILTNTILDSFVVLILLIDYMGIVSGNNVGSYLGLEEYFFIAVLFFQLLIIISLFIKWNFIYYSLQKWKITYYNWVLIKNKKEFILSQIGNIDLKQSILWKIFNYGDVILHIHSQQIKLSYIPNPENFINLLHFFREN